MKIFSKKLHIFFVTENHNAIAYYSGCISDSKQKQFQDNDDTYTWLLNDFSEESLREGYKGAVEL